MIGSDGGNYEDRMSTQLQDVKRESTGCLHRYRMSRESTRCQQSAYKMSTQRLQDVNRASTGCLKSVYMISTERVHDVA